MNKKTIDYWDKEQEARQDRIYNRTLQMLIANDQFWRIADLENKEADSRQSVIVSVIVGVALALAIFLAFGV